MTAEQRAEVDELRASAEAHKGAGKLQECGETIDKAVAILKLAEDTHMFNKSE